MMIGRFQTDAGTELPLSNFYEAEFTAPPFGRVTAPSLTWPSAEHYYQAAKCLLPTDVELIRHALSPALAKKMGRQVLHVPEWNEIRLLVMRKALWYKFQFGTSLGAYLTSTAPMYLREGNTWGDQFWGTDMNGVGQNWLGLLLMARRAELLCVEDEAK